MTRLAVDVGNTKTALAVFSSGKLIDQWRIRTLHWTSDELRIILDSLLRTGNHPLPEDMAFASVVPQVCHSLHEMGEKMLGCTPVEVTHETACIKMDYLFPHEVGPDRLANAIAAVISGPLPAIVADFGTATTFDVVDSEGRYAGGAISPGVGTAAVELFKKAERLNPIDLKFPDSPIGRTTADAVRAGVLYGASGAADHIVDLLLRELGQSAFLWATGGWGEGLAKHSRHRFRVCPELTLTGIDEIGRRNREGAARG
jgi:type III pantothenate kinase